MARQRPPDRLEKLIEVAAAAFVEHGFQRTQMEDVAARLGVSKGTVYGSVDSKESLLAAVLTHADAPHELRAGGPFEPAVLAEVSSTLGDRLTGPGTIGRIRSAQAGHPSGLLGRLIGRLMVKDTAAANDRPIEMLALDERCSRSVWGSAARWPNWSPEGTACSASRCHRRCSTRPSPATVARSATAALFSWRARANHSVRRSRCRRRDQHAHRVLHSRSKRVPRPGTRRGRIDAQRRRFPTDRASGR